MAFIACLPGVSFQVQSSVISIGVLLNIRLDIKSTLPTVTFSLILNSHRSRRSRHIRDRLFATRGLGKILLPDVPAATPPNPAALVRAASDTQDKRQRHEADAETAARDPAASRVELGPSRRAGHLAHEREQHERGVDAVAALGLDGVDCRAVGGLGDLETCVERKRLDDGPHHRVRAGVRAEGNADAEHQAAGDARERGRKRLDDVLGVERPHDDAGDADQREQPDRNGRVVVGRVGEEER